MNEEMMGLRHGRRLATRKTAFGTIQWMCVNQYQYLSMGWMSDEKNGFYARKHTYKLHPSNGTSSMSRTACIICNTLEVKKERKKTSGHRCRGTEAHKTRDIKGESEEARIIRCSSIPEEALDLEDLRQNTRTEGEWNQLRMELWPSDAAIDM